MLICLITIYKSIERERKKKILFWLLKILHLYKMLCIYSLLTTYEPFFIDKEIKCDILTVYSFSVCEWFMRSALQKMYLDESLFQFNSIPLYRSFWSLREAMPKTTWKNASFLCKTLPFEACEKKNIHPMMAEKCKYAVYVCSSQIAFSCFIHRFFFSFLTVKISKSRQKRGKKIEADLHINQYNTRCVFHVHTSGALQFFFISSFLHSFRFILCSYDGGEKKFNEKLRVSTNTRGKV